jgi:glycosyltransferase involved in cell wall biosynthesis
MLERVETNLPSTILVIVCAYNEEKYLISCLDSIDNSVSMSGAHNRFKLVCVDNSSNDNTWNLAQKFSASSVHYECIKIHHSPLCVSRNSYKFYSDFQYVAYIDADGGVDIGWAKSLLEMVDSTESDIISGPVLNLPQTGRTNGLWEVFYDSSIGGSDDYIIGANMCFSANFLHSVDGFPRVFEARGDETCLLLKAKLLGLASKVLYQKNMIAYNHFPVSRKNFLKEQFYDGIRSSQIARLWTKRNVNVLNVNFRIVRVLSLLLSLILIPISYHGAVLCFLVSVCLIFLRRPNFMVRVFNKVLQRSNSASMIDGLAVLVSFYIFDLGFIKGFLSKNPVSEAAVFSSSCPKRVMSDD